MTPNNANELSTTMKVVTALMTKFAVRSGGHKDSPGFSSIGSDGVLISLQNLNQLQMSADKKIATVGPGNRWDEVYDFAAKYGVSVVGGRQPTVGVGGFLLGGKNKGGGRISANGSLLIGGIGLFCNDYGLGLDQVTRYQVDCIREIECIRHDNLTVSCRLSLRVVALWMPPQPNMPIFTRL